MNTITESFKQAEFALAAYASLSSGMSKADLINALKSKDMTNAQATAFAAKWNVVTQYTDISGLSATVFQEVATGKRYLAIRGTELNDPGDIVSAGIILSGFIPLDLAAQYVLLKTQVQIWLTDGTLAAGFSVSGHSLGGYLAVGLEADFGASIGNAYLYNAPGLNGVLGSATAAILAAFGITAPVDPSKILNLKADAGISPIAGLGTQVAPAISIHIENQFLSDAVNPPLSYNHSQRVLTDALALYAAYAQADSTASVTSITNIIKASSNLNGNTLELALDKLRELLLGATVPGTVPEGRESYYTNLYQLTNWLTARSSSGTAPALKFDALTSYGGTAIAAKAIADTPDGLAYRYALTQLNPFALTGDASIYASHNAAGELNLYNPITGSGALTDLYLKDRAAMLSWKLKFDTGAPDSDDPLTPRADKPYSEQWDSWSISGDWDFIDKASGIKLAIDGVDLTTTVNHQIVFGSQNADTLTGDSLSDHLYGGAGADTLTGDGGNDTLEGGQGNDTYLFSPGDGTDTVLDSDGQGKLMIGSLEIKGSTGLTDPTKWKQLGSDTWIDQQNGITYSKSVVSGETQLLIHQGDSNILVKGWSAGELGIELGTGALTAAPTHTYTGSNAADVIQNVDMAGWTETQPTHLEHAIPGWVNRYDGLDGADFIVTDLVDDIVDGGAGNDYVLSLEGGADSIDGGTGNDLIQIGDSNTSWTVTPTDNRTYVDGGDGNDSITVTRKYLASAIALDGPAAGLAYHLSDVAGIDFAATWAADYAGWQRGLSDFNVLPGVPGFSFTGFSRDGVHLAQGTDGQLNFYLTFQFSVAEFSHYFQDTGGLTRFAPIFLYDPSRGNDDTTAHTLFGGAGDDLVEGGFGDDFIDGGADNDMLDGERGADVIYGGTGDDLILGGEGNDWLYGGAGSDEIYGEQGNDTYVFAKGDGLDRISDHDTTVGNVDVVQFLDVASDEVTALNRYGNDLTISYGMSDQLTAVNYFSVADRIEQIQFSDGEVWGLGSVKVRVVNNIIGTAGNDALRGGYGSDRLDGGAGDDDLYGDSGPNPYPGLGNNDVLLGGDGNDLLLGDDRYTAGNDVLDGGAGNDSLTGGEGNDTYLFGKGDGQDTITEHLWVPFYPTPDEFNVLQFKPGVVSSEVVVTGQRAGLLFSIAGTLDQVTVWYDLQGNDFSPLRQIRFDDGTTWDMATVMASLFAGTPDGDTIFGTLAGDTINGQAGDDSLIGGGGDDILIGGDGNDRLGGSAGNDILDGGAGNDGITGDAGSDTYLFGRGDGQDSIATSYYGFIPHTLADGELNVLQYKAGVLPGDIVVTGGENSGSIELKIAGTADQVHISGFFNGSNPVQQVRFADGTIWGVSDLTAKYFAGTPGDDVLSGTINSNTINGQAGRDTIYGGEGNDVIDGGADDDTLVGDAGNDVIRGGSGDDTLFGGDGSDTLDGGAGNDFIVSSAVYGGAGNDTYLFGKGDGQDIIDADSSGAGYGRLNVLEFKPGVAPSEIVVTRLTDVINGDALVLTIAGSADKVTVQRFFTNDDPANNYNPLQQVKFSDGTIWDLATITSKLPTNHAPVLSAALPDQAAAQGGAFNYTFASAAFTDPDAGDTLTYSATLADGSALPSWISFNAATRTFSGTPSLLGATSVRVTAQDIGNLTASDVFDIVVSVQDLTLNGTSGVDTLNGGTGNDTLNGLAGNDALNGNAGNDRLDGGVDVDSMAGSTGDDTYVVDNAGDIVTENLNEGYWDTVESTIGYTLGANVENLTLTGTTVINGTGNELANVLRGNSAANTMNGLDGNDTIYADNSDTAHGGNGNDTLVSVNTGTWSYLYGEAGDDTLTGGSYSGMFAGGLGNDTIVGGVGMNFIWGDDQEWIAGGAGGGNDTITGGNNYDYVIAGSGDDIVYGNGGDDSLAGNAGNDTLYGGAGNDFIYGGSGTDTLVGGTGDDTYGVDNAGDIVTENAGEGIDTIQSSIAYTLGANVENLTLSGTAVINGVGNELANVLTGNAAANVLDGGLGADTLVGGLGNDTYLMSRSYGMDAVVENDATAGNTDVAQFLSGVATDQIWFQHTGNNLEVSIIGTADKWVIQDWYTGTANHVEQFKTTDGAKTLLDSQVDNLVNAMASFAPPAAGQTTLPPAYQTTLNPVIAANWQ